MTTDELLAKMATVMQCGGDRGFGFYARAMYQPHFAYDPDARVAMEKALEPPPPTKAPSVRRKLDEETVLAPRRPTAPPARRRASLFEDE